MKQHDIAKIISRRTDITQRTVNDVLNALSGVFADLFFRGEQIRLSVGIFEPKIRPAKPAYDFQNGKKMTLPPATIVNFRPAAKIQRVLVQKDRERRGTHTQMDVTVVGDE